MFISVQKEIEKLLKKVEFSGEIELGVPPKAEMGDIALPCFVLAKEMKKSPVEVAKELAGKIDLQSAKFELIEKVIAFGPYVNFFLKSGAVVGEVVKEVLKKEEKFGRNKNGLGQGVMLEYPSNNTHKEFHIGHFRNVCLGNVIVGLYRENGYKVYPVNYLNDFGSHVAKCLWGLQKFHASEVPPENKQKWLGQIYAEASGYAKEHVEVAPEISAMQKSLERKDKEIWPLFMETRKWSIDKFDDLFAELKVKHDKVYYESDIKARGQEVVDTLLKKKIAKVGEGGAIIVDLSPYNLDVALLRKSDGAGLYMTSDVPLAEEKLKKFKVDESIVITGQEQTFYFKQLFKVLELMGFKKKFTHLNYGLVNLPEGKMSSRTGKVILYEDLRDQVLASMLKETKDRHADWSEKKIHDTAKKLALASLKFDMQKHEAIKNIVFDIKEATSFEGFSGPYILYVIARINSLLRKYDKKIKAKVDCSLLGAPEEKQLAVLLEEFKTVVIKALADYNPSVLARYAFDLAKAFNDFYNKCHILNAESAELTEGRLALALAVKTVLEKTLSLLTIETVEEM